MRSEESVYDCAQPVRTCEQPSAVRYTYQEVRPAVRLVLVRWNGARASGARNDDLSRNFLAVRLVRPRADCAMMDEGQGIGMLCKSVVCTHSRWCTTSPMDTPRHSKQPGETKLLLRKNGQGT